MIHIGSEKAIEPGDRSIGPQEGRTRAIDRLDVDRGTLDIGGLHLACDGALPDQFIKPCLIVVEIAAHVLRMAGEIRRADGFVRFLRVLGLAGIIARLFRHIFRAEALADCIAGRIDGFRRHLHTVGTHIGDQAGSFATDIDAFIKPLRHLHGARCGETELAGCRLLQG